MPRDLADVLHHFLPELEAESAAGDPSLPLPVLGIPMGDRDVVGAALAWNLSIETARRGGAAVILAPEFDQDSPIWPAVGPSDAVEMDSDIPGARVVFRPARNLAELYTAAEDLAASEAEKARRGGVVFVRIPLAWLIGPPGHSNPIRWLLLLSGTEDREIDETSDRVRALAMANPACEVGITIHGATTISEAREAFETLASRCEADHEVALISYGMLVDDLHVYRSMANGRPIVLAYPQSPASKAMTDVARLIYEDARSRVLG